MEKRLKPLLALSSCDSFFSLHKCYLENPNGENVRNRISNTISKFNKNPTVNEIGIIVLLRPFWVSAEKIKAMMRKVFLSAKTWYQNSQRWEWSKLGYERDAQISRRSNGERIRDRHFSETGLVGCGKKKGFWVEKREKRKWGGAGTVIIFSISDPDFSTCFHTRIRCPMGLKFLFHSHTRRVSPTPIRTRF